MKVTLQRLVSVDVVVIAVVGFAVYRYALSQVPVIQTLVEKRATSFVQTQSAVLAATAQSKVDSVLTPLKIITAPWNPWS